jgi:hypothetical protein
MACLVDAYDSVARLTLWKKIPGGLYQLLPWNIQFDRRTIILTKEEENVLVSGVYIKTKKINQIRIFF